MPPRKPPIDTIPLFGEPEPAKRPAPKAAAAAKAKPTWSRYKPKNPVRCDHCMRVLAETGGRGPVAALARYSRTAGGTRELLCYQHAQAQREADRLPALKKEIST
jgi:hypothetical protein